MLAALVMSRGYGEAFAPVKLPAAPLAAPPREGDVRAVNRSWLWLVIALVIAVAAFGAIGDVRGLGARLHEFAWPALAAALALALANYAIRFVRWQYYLAREGVRVPVADSAIVFGAGLSLSITPGKLGELVKAVLLRDLRGVPVPETAPIVVAERVTDLIALVVLSLVGVAAYGIGTTLVIAAAIAIGTGLVLLAWPRPTRWIIDQVTRPRPLARLRGPLHETLTHLSELCRPLPLAVATVLAVPAWTCECIGFALICDAFPGTHVALPLAIAIYASTTIAGSTNAKPAARRVIARPRLDTPFRPQPDSPYGFAPLESVLLTANTDLRFQTHFLQYFTAGTVPHGFMTLPEGISTPDQIREYQAYWDALMWGEQEAKHQIKLVPFGSSFEWPRDESFDDKFSVYLMQKVAAAYHVVPSDLGFTNDVNRATGETQVDVQFRVGTLPLVQHIEDILNDYLQNDRGLPVELSFDTGQEKEDRVQVAQAHKIYVEMGAESVDEVRSQELGLPIDNERPMPRFILDPKAGPIPLGNVYSIAGVIDPETAGPSDYVPLGLKPYDGAEGVLASKSPGGAQFARAPQNPDEPNFPQLEHVVPGTDVLGTKPAAPVIGDPGIEDATQADSADSNGVLSKEMTAGVTSATGIVGYDLGGDDDDDDEDFDGAAVTKELATFRAFVKTRARKGKYRDFHFDAVSALNPVWAHRLNDTARARIRKDAGLLVAAGLCVYAMDTTRVLMLQRSLDELDPASGMWEFPGGHLEDGEDAFAAAVREFAEETGCPLPVGSHTGTWTDPTGVYQGFVWTVAEEASVPIFDREDYKNPDDPDGDVIESIAWWPVTLLPGNPAMRAELVASMDAVQSALPQPAPPEAEPVVDDGLVKADVPKGPAGNPRWHQPVRAAEGKAIDHHAAAIRTAMTGAASKDQLRALVAKYMGSHG